MNNRLAKTLLATAAVAALAAPVAAQASQGADDPAGHVRQESRQTTATPPTATPTTSTTAKQKTSDDNRGRHRGRRHGRRHGAAPTTTPPSAAPAPPTTTAPRHSAAAAPTTAPTTPRPTTSPHPQAQGPARHQRRPGPAAVRAGHTPRRAFVAASRRLLGRNSTRDGVGSAAGRVGARAARERDRGLDLAPRLGIAAAGRRRVGGPHAREHPAHGELSHLPAPRGAHGHEQRCARYAQRPDAQIQTPKPRRRAPTPGPLRHDRRGPTQQRPRRATARRGAVPGPGQGLPPPRCGHSVRRSGFARTCDPVERQAHRYGLYGVALASRWGAGPPGPLRTFSQPTARSFGGPSFVSGRSGRRLGARNDARRTPDAPDAADRAHGRRRDSPPRTRHSSDARRARARSRSSTGPVLINIAGVTAPGQPADDQRGRFGD